MQVEPINQCAYCAMFGKSNCTRFKCGEPICNTPIFNVGSGVTEYECFDNSHSNDKILWGAHAKYVQTKEKENRQ